MDFFTNVSLLTEDAIPAGEVGVINERRGKSVTVLVQQWAR